MPIRSNGQNIICGVGAHLSLSLQTLHHVRATTGLQWSESNTDSASLSMRSNVIGACFDSTCGGKGDS